jgi:Ca2+-binding RTX toxin-like protein
MAAGSLMAFQALAVIGAQVALAATTCTFNLGTGAVTVQLDGADLNTSIFVNTPGASIETNDGVDCGSATTTNTTSISASGTATANETITIDNDGAGGAFPSTISWAVDLAGGTNDQLAFNLSDSADTLTLGNTTFTMNGGTGVTAGLEQLSAQGNDGTDAIDGSAITSTGPASNGDCLDGGSGDDTIKGGAAVDCLDGDNGEDTINGGGGADDIFGGDDDDLIAGDAGDDLLFGGDGDDTFSEGTAANGSDEIDGQGEDTFPFDIVDYSGRTCALTVAVATGFDDGCAGENDDVDSGTEGVLGGSGADSLTGDSDDNWLSGGPGNDALNGGLCCADDDTAAYDTATAAVTVDLAAGTATGGAGTDTLTLIDDAVGSNFNDTLTGDANQNDLDGRGGDDLIAGAGEDDDEFGGAGNDTFNQGATPNGEDEIEGEAGLDWVNYGARTAAVNVSFDDSFNDGDIATGEDDNVNTVENATLGTSDDTFFGNGFNNIVQPNGGQNILDGEGGGDSLDYSVGYTAGVTIDLGGGASSVDSIAGFENVTGTAFADSITGGIDNNLIKSGKGADRVRAGAGDDTVRAGAGNDNVRGSSGDDDLFGMAGNDSLSGGKGDDFCAGGKGKDTTRGCESGHA